jgi:hypothetical protein
MSDPNNKIVKVESIEEANAHLSSGWELIDNGHTIIEGTPQFFFVLKKTQNLIMQEMIDKLTEEENEKSSAVKSE